MIATSSVTFSAPVVIRMAQNVVFATYARLGVLRLFQMKNDLTQLILEDSRKKESLVDVALTF